MTEASLKRSAKASFSTEAHVASQSDDSSLSNHMDDLLINPKAGIGPAPDCKSNKPWLAMQSRQVPTINGGLPSYDSPRRQSSSPLPKYGASPLCSPAENAESTQGKRRWIENFYVWIYDQPVTSPITAGHPLEGSLNNTSPSSHQIDYITVGVAEDLRGREIRRLESIDRSIKLTLKNLNRTNNNEVAGIKPRYGTGMRMRKRITINNPLTGLVRQILKLGLRLQLISFVIAIDDWVVGCILRLEDGLGLLRGKRTTERLKREGKGNKDSFQRVKTRMTAPRAHDGDRC
ncbi:hypothetical protein PPACK8108_LOCUS25285 [Phakopsora pachyrhizi]|uniref:Uncharacterized protein n=1 Tax=Phakopsora pachyrhizi TaxID=170000 RepID=A0AAV0BWV2_PHAPC|nr:hypothetical protein PPACK8108_LOCUS25285 [Phakopsora pachyrhizi]